MIDLHAGATPNGFKIAILLEELDPPHRQHPVDITDSVAHSVAFLVPARTNNFKGRPFEGAVILRAVRW